MWWMFALALNAQPPLPSAPTAQETAALRAELDEAMREVSAGLPLKRPAGAAAPTPAGNVAPLAPISAAPIAGAPIAAVGSALAPSGPSWGSWAALALLGAGVGGFSVWKKRQRGRIALLNIRETAPLGKGKLLAVVDTGGRRLLIGVTEQGMQLLANEVQPAEPLAALGRTPDAPVPNAQRFDDHLPPLEGEELRKKLAARFA